MSNQRPSGDGFVAIPRSRSAFVITVAELRLIANGRQKPTGQRIENAGGQRDAESVVNEREAEALLRVGDRVFGNPPRLGDPAQVASDERDLALFIATSVPVPIATPRRPWPGPEHR